MHHSHRFCLLVLALLVVAGTLPAYGHPAAQTDEPHRIHLPLMIGPPLTNSPFGFDTHHYSSDVALQYAVAAKPRWTRAGTAFWDGIEAERGVYNWDAVAGVEANVRRLRQAGIEPTLVVQRSPAWAQLVPGRLCSPPSREALPDFVNFMRALVGHFSQGELAVNYWEIGNETDLAPEAVSDDVGIGCWMNFQAPDLGGGYYGEVLKQITPVIKAANPNAQVIAGSLLYAWPDDSASRAYLEGILASGAGDSFDALSYHAYGEWGAGDLLVDKAIRIRETLAKYGLEHKPLVATEVAATCGSNTIASCPPTFDLWVQRQANYAARIYAEAIALDLKGAFWYTLTSPNPGFRYSHLIDDQDGTLVPRPAYYAFLNSANLLNGARYVGPPLAPVPPERIDEVQALKFHKARSSFDNRPSTLYVIWVPRIGSVGVSYPIYVTPGARAVCSTKLSGSPESADPSTRMRTFYCSDTNNDGVIWFSVIDFPQYIEVIE